MAAIHSDTSADVVTLVSNSCVCVGGGGVEGGRDGSGEKGKHRTDIPTFKMYSIVRQTSAKPSAPDDEPQQRRTTCSTSHHMRPI